MDYIYILDYETGNCVIRTIPEDADIELWLYDEMGYKESQIYYMTSSTLNLDIQV